MPAFPVLDFPTAFAVAALCALLLGALVALLALPAGGQGVRYAAAACGGWACACLWLALHPADARAPQPLGQAPAELALAYASAAMALCYQRFRGQHWGTEDRALLVAPGLLFALAWLVWGSNPHTQARAHSAIVMGMALWQASALLRMRTSALTQGWRWSVAAQAALVLSTLPLLAMASAPGPALHGAMHGIVWALFAALLAGWHATIYGYVRMVQERRDTSQQQAARLDSLTQLTSRRTLMELIPQAMAKAEADSKPLGLLVMDIDHFKKINDMYGHLGGDAVLQRVAWVLRTQVRQEDTVARYGGEEFVLLVPNATPALLLATAQRIGDAVRAETVAYDGARIGVSVSMGGHVQKVSPGLRWEELLAAADAALYEAKNTGRDRVVLSVVSRAQLAPSTPQRAPQPPRRGPETGERHNDTTRL